MDNLSAEATALIVMVTTVLSQFVKPVLMMALRNRGGGNVTVQVNSDGNTQVRGGSSTPSAPGGDGGTHSGILGSKDLLELLLSRSGESREATIAERELRERYLSLAENQEDRLNDQATTIERLICHLERVGSGGSDDEGAGG